MTKLLALLVVVVLGGGGVAGYQHHERIKRSATNYCKTFFTEGQKVRQEYMDADRNANQDPLQALSVGLSAPSEFAEFFGKLDKGAPDDIEPDVAAVAHNFQQQADSQGQQASSILTNPLGALAGSLTRGFAGAPALQRVDNWSTAHCGARPAA